MSATFPAKDPMTSSKPIPWVSGGLRSNEEGHSFRVTVDALRARSNGMTSAEAETIVEELDKLVQGIRDKGEEDYCLRALAEVCREHVILPGSCKVSDVELREERKFGGVADIWMGKHTQEGEVCVKVFRQYEDADQQKIKGALYCRAVQWKHISHPNVLPFLGVSGPEIVYPFGLITPRMSGNIIEYTEEHKDADRLLLLKEAACGLEYLHSLDIVHGGINPRNILVTSRGTACIGDFGIAEVITDPLLMGQCCTTIRPRPIVRYMAPEQLEKSITGRESDVHSFAITAYEALVRIEPYRGVTGEGPLAVLIMSGFQPPRPENVRLPDHIWGILASCWARKPSARPTIEMVHQAFQGEATVDSLAPGHKVVQGSAPSDPPRRKAVPQMKYGFARLVQTVRHVQKFRKNLKNRRKQ